MVRQAGASGLSPRQDQAKILRQSILIMTNRRPPPIVSANTIATDPVNSEKREQFQLTIAEPVTRVLQQEIQFKQTIADQLAQIEALQDAAKDKESYDAVVLRLREANQNLVIATLGAQDLQAKAEATSLRQEEFLAMLAHELRNPLAPMAMAAQLLGKITVAHPQLPKLHGILVRQVCHMTRLVDDLIDASRIKTGKITLQKCPILLSEIIHSAIETSRPFIDQRQQLLTVDLPEDPVVIDGDLVRLTQVFSNLLVNATKFTHERGHISVSVRVLAESVAVSVRDNGVGIAAELQPTIFELFIQGPRSLDRSQGGLGIGLSLVHTVVEMHCGSTEVRSDGLGQGSEFTVILPISAKSILQDISPESKADAKAGAVSQRRILIIEDNVDANETLNEALVQDGHIITSAFDGLAGLARAKENIYDVIICDIGLPRMSGFGVVRHLFMHSSKSVPCCIAMSGYSELVNRTHALEVGFDHYLVKPIDINNLRRLISTCLRQ